MTTKTGTLSRRHFLTHTARLAFASATLPLASRAMASFSQSSSLLPDARSIAFAHTHTGEHLSLVYAAENRYLPESLHSLNRFLRDHYSGEVGSIDPQLFDLLFQIRQALGARQPFEVISGYRCPTTNSNLRNTRGGGVAKHSLHMEGKAIDIRLPGVPLRELRDAALSLQAGGVGFYPSSQFVHVDTGRVRSWQG